MKPGDTSVLIIEDEAIVAEIYGLALRRSGHRVLKATDGADGLRMAAETLPDFIFLDNALDSFAHAPTLDVAGCGFFVHLQYSEAIM